MISTWAEAAQKALAWAEAAESAHKNMSARRARATACAERRGSANEAALWHDKADACDRTRVAAVEMATMWADITHALRLVEREKPS